MIPGGPVSGESDSGDPVEVRLLAFPLDVYAQAREHTDELLREVALLAMAPEGDGSSAPRRLLDIVTELTERYSGYGTETDAERDSALERGERTVDLVYRVRPASREATMRLSTMLEEADDFCRQGDLLTLATPPEALAFRRWYLAEFVRQIDGHPPLPWPAYAATSGTPAS